MKIKNIKLKEKFVKKVVQTAEEYRPFIDFNDTSAIKEACLFFIDQAPRKKESTTQISNT